MSIRFSTLLLLTGLSLSLKAQQPTCETYRNGKFKLTLPAIGTAIIERQGAVQTELHGTEKFTFDVKWLSNCRYTLRPTKESLKRMKGVPATALVTVEIVKLTKNSYYQVATSNFTTQKIAGEMVRMKL